MQRELEKIKKGQYANVYVLHGTEDYLMQRMKQAIKAIVPEEDHELNISQYSAVDTSLVDIISDAMSLPFLSETKIIFVENCYFLTGEKVKTTIEQPQEVLLEYVEQPNPSTILVLLAPYTALDKRKKIVKTLQEKATTISVMPMSPEETAQYMQQEVGSVGYRVDRDVMTFFLERVNFQLSLAMKEWQKLALATLTTKVITKQIVETLVPKSLESNVFSLGEFVLSQQTQKAIQTYRELVLQKEEPIKLLALLISQYRLLLQIKVLQEKGYQHIDIVKLLKQHPYRVQVGMAQANRFSLSQIATVFRQLIQTDYQLKTSAMDKQFIVEMALMTAILGK